jgi:hypothetical protein
VQQARKRVQDARNHHPELHREIENSTWRLLRAETSCNFYWGEAWVPRAHNDLDHSAMHLARVHELLG